MLIFMNSVTCMFLATIKKEQKTKIFYGKLQTFFRIAGNALVAHK